MSTYGAWTRFRPSLNRISHCLVSLPNRGPSFERTGANPVWAPVVSCMHARVRVSGNAPSQASNLTLHPFWYSVKPPTTSVGNPSSFGPGSVLSLPRLVL